MRYIKLTEELKQKALQEFQEKLLNERFSNDKINFTFDLKENKQLEDKDKIIVNINVEAWLKMWGLVSSESGEIGWHGLVERRAPGIFEITNILLYPQYVTGTTVQTDDVGYGNWLHKEISDEDINRLRYHGHSHVNMSTTPSGVDTSWYNEILQGLSNDDFYIFMILNKREDYFIEIYDLATNTIYEKKDIIINVLLSDNNYLQNWITKEKQKALQTRPVEVTPRLDAFKRLDDIKPFDADDEIEANSNFEDLLLNLTSADLKDTALIQGVMTELEQRALWNGYFGVGYLQWQTLEDCFKIELAQAYYEESNKLSVKDKQLKYNKNKSKKYKNDYNSYYWRD